MGLFSEVSSRIIRIGCVRELKVLLIAESGFLFDVCLAQDLSSIYLMDMAEAGTIAMAVPEYSLVEIDGQAADKIQGRKKRYNARK